MKKTLLTLVTASILGGCAIIQSTGLNETDPTLTTQRTAVKKEFDEIKAPANGKPISVAVYSFADKTGQRRPQANIASLSTAVTQGAETFLIQALQNVGKGRWFEVVERVGIDNLTKERTIIRQMREAYEGANAKPLMPMQFAGMILEGGLVGYDTTTTSGGAGMRIFGIGKQTQWSQDTVTVSLRAVSVNTGKVLATVTVQKTILSTSDSATALKFFDAGTQAFEAEAGLTINEPGTYAVKSAVEMAVVELIKEGIVKGIWEYKVDAPVAAAPVVERKAPVISSEIKVEEKKDVVVQNQTPQAVATQPSPVPTRSATESGSRKSDEGNKRESKTVEEKTVESRPLFGQRKLTEAQFIYKEPDEKSQKTWQFKKGTVVNVIQPGSEGWLRVTDSEKRGGWVRTEQLEEMK
jgi:curli production assembly/transport component CsgG